MIFMIKEKLEHYLQTESFFPLTTKLSDVTVLVKFENNLANILQIIDYAKELYLDKEIDLEQYKDFEQLEEEYKNMVLQEMERMDKNV